MNAETYRCPYCCSDIPAQAIVCSHCARDLTLFRPLALQMQALEASQVQLRDEIARLRLSSSLPTSENQTTPADPISGNLEASPSWKAWLGMAWLTIGLLGLSHWVLFFLYDAPPLALRVLTIVLPMLTGYLAARWSELPLAVQLLSSLWVGVISVMLMLTITAHIDAVPLWPANTREWKETLEYAAAIVLGYFTGALMHHLLQHIARRNTQKLRLSVLLERDAKGQLRIADISNQVQSLVSALAPLVSAGSALYSGLKIFMGD